MGEELPWFLRSALNHADAADNFVYLTVQKLVALKLNSGVVIVEFGLPIPELPVPLATFPRLQTVFIADKH